MLEGLHPNRPTHVFRITTDGRSARAMTDMIGEIFDPAETAVASFETEDGGPWLLEAYFASQPDEAAIRESAAAHRRRRRRTRGSSCPSIRRIG